MKRRLLSGLLAVVMLFTTAFAVGAAGEAQSEPPNVLTFEAVLPDEYSTDRMEDAVAEEVYRVVEARLLALNIHGAEITFPEDRKTVVVTLPAGTATDPGVDSLSRRGIVEFRDADGKVWLTNKFVESADFSYGHPTAEVQEEHYYVKIFLTVAGESLLTQATEAISARKDGKNTLHIVMDGEEVSVQPVTEKVTGKNYVIWESLTEQSAHKLADELALDIMPVTLVPERKPTEPEHIVPDFPDVAGHWAEASLNRAAALGLIKGIDGKMMPDSPLKTSEAIALLNRTLGATVADDVSGMHQVSQSAWFREDLGKALHLGLVAADDSRNFDTAATRAEAFLLMARAFVYDRAGADAQVLRIFTDTDSMTEEQLQAAAALVDAGIVQGNTATTLEPEGKLTRAQFVTMLLRIVANFPGDEAAQAGGTLIRDAEVMLEDMQSADTYVLSVDTTAVEVNGGALDGRLVLKGAEDVEMTAKNDAQIGTLAVDPAGTAAVTMQRGTAVDTLVIAGMGDAVSYKGEAREIEITASGREINLTGMQAERLTITGSGNTIVMNGAAQEVYVNAGAKNTHLTLTQATDTLLVAGRGTTVEGKGKAKTVDIRATDCNVSIDADSKTENIDTGLEGVQIEMGVPTKVKPGGSLLTQVKFTGVTEEKICTAQWYQDGKPLERYHSEHFVLAPDKISRHTADFTFTKDMKTSVTMGFKLTYDNPSTGELEELYVEKTVPIENYSDEWYRQRDVNRILKLVSSTYRGNYTTDYAVKNDYKPFEKEIWINAKGYASNSEYLLWINRAYQHVNVFKGSKGNWKLIKSFLVGTGAAGSQTPVGVTTVSYKQASGWTTSTYTVRPVVGFYPGTGYAFHSRLSYPGTDKEYDFSAGYPVSHGCVRMYKPDIQWIYNNIPIGTTVVIF